MVMTIVTYGLGVKPLAGFGIAEVPRITGHRRSRTMYPSAFTVASKLDETTVVV